FFLVFTFCFAAAAHVGRVRRRGLGSLRAGSGSVRALLVTAHPDDECMFFAPAVLQLVQSGAAVRLLCLSSGNYYNQGAQRKKELLASCAVLGIPASHVTVVENKELPDDPKAEWSTALTSMLIHKHIKTHSINMVLTFDEGGVSGHTNHIAIYRAVRALWHYMITSLLKYLSTKYCIFIYWSIIVTTLLKYLSTKILNLSLLEAMLCHRSQLLWFRRLYILFSRYMFINTFKAVAVETKHVKIY
uniref:N-acetylglucosaminylphosphatidylinositol deacetylase n=1 Tax=Astyanax mexicanus TaxID=7994 RepID=A0A8B9H4D8_ASTMX